MSKKIKLISLTILVLSLAACQAGGDSEDDPKNSCSEIGLETKVLNGTACVEGNSPVVSLELTVTIDNLVQTGLCSGSLITPDTVLTAAHCFNEGEVTQIVVTGGSTGSGSQRAFATSYYVHPGFDTAVDGTLKNDAAIVKLEKSLSLPTFPIITSRDIQPGDRLDIYGFGQDDEQTAGFLKSGILHIDDISQDNIFAVYDDKSSATCFGDSGGPAVYSLDTATEQDVVGLVGLTSTGEVDATTHICAEGQRQSFTNIQNPEVLNFIAENAPGVVTR